MKKVIIGMTLGAFCCGLFSAPVFALKYDPNLPSQTQFENPADDGTSDEIGWGEPLTVSGDGTLGLSPAEDNIEMVIFDNTVVGFFIKIVRIRLSITKDANLISYGKNDRRAADSPNQEAASR